jgi:hypothetical protein
MTILAFPVAASPRPRWELLRGTPGADLEHEWRAFLRRNPLASHFVSPRYFAEPAKPEATPFALVCRGSHGNVTAVATGFERHAHLVSGAPHRPQCVVGADGSRSAAADLADAFLQCAEGSSLATIYLWEPNPSLAERGFRTVKGKGTFVLDLEPTEAALFAEFSATKRNTIRQAERRGLTVELADRYTDLTGLDRIFRETDRRHGLPPRSREALRAVRAGLDPCRKLFVARRDGALVAATVIRYVRGGLAEYSENASDERAWPYRPNEALLWSSIRWAREIGCHAFSFGGATSFKSGFGAELRPVYRMRRDATFLRRHDRKEWLATRLRAVPRTVLGRLRPR